MPTHALALPKAECNMVNTIWRKLSTPHYFCFDLQGTGRAYLTCTQQVVPHVELGGLMMIRS